jgi:phage terminase small subunit
MTKRKEPSVRAKKYIKNKIAGMSDYQAAIKAGYSPNTAVAAAKNIENPSVEAAMEEILDRAGLTDEYMAGKLREATEATKIHGTNDNFVEIKDWMAILKALDLGYRVKGKMVEKKDVNLKSSNVIVLPEQELNDKRMDTSQGATDGSIEENGV